jgi:hypothetical protein
MTVRNELPINIRLSCDCHVDWWTFTNVWRDRCLHLQCENTLLYSEHQGIKFLLNVSNLLAHLQGRIVSYPEEEGRNFLPNV